MAAITLAPPDGRALVGARTDLNPAYEGRVCGRFQRRCGLRIDERAGFAGMRAQETEKT